MFEFNYPYNETDPRTIRSDFAELTITDSDNSYASHLLDKLASYVTTDVLREFMDDLAMDRV